MNEQQGMTVIKHGILSRALLFLFAGGWIYIFGIEFVKSNSAENWLKSTVLIALAVSIVCVVISIGWTTIAFDSEVVRKHVPFVTKRTVLWADVNGYRDGFPSRALYVTQNAVLEIPEMLPNLELLWNECTARGIARR